MTVRRLSDHDAHSSNRARLETLLGDRIRSVLALATCSVASGLTEAAILALLAQIAASAATGSHHVESKLGLFHFHAPAGTLFIVALVLTVVRIALQAPLSILAARIAADVQARLRRELFDAFTR